MAACTQPGLPHPSDPPCLIAILIAAKKTGDKTMSALASQWLEEAGISVRFAKDAPALRHGGKAVRHA
ncbi:hypothetical protein [Limnoglobus roseus]|uniref:Uncharacterized protein n=1 Tax=Limnoglobus roseus TaxID=2598579 RepID=A0A5C1A5R2_9BACT|nr:hypothetical protein [Limnoglobus roseus]QEL14040.1 hypothetical protein PX52LOC_00903 [Limnoglobus roseus]